MLTLGKGSFCKVLAVQDPKFPYPWVALKVPRTGKLAATGAYMMRLLPSRICVDTLSSSDNDDNDTTPFAQKLKALSPGLYLKTNPQHALKRERRFMKRVQRVLSPVWSINLHPILPSSTPKIMMDMAPFTLRDYLYAKRFQNATQVCSVAVQLFAQLAMLHNEGIAHQDIRLSNIVVFPVQSRTVQALLNKSSSNSKNALAVTFSSVASTDTSSSWSLPTVSLQHVGLVKLIDYNCAVNMPTHTNEGLRVQEKDFEQLRTLLFEYTDKFKQKKLLSTVFRRWRRSLRLLRAHHHYRKVHVKVQVK